MSVYRPAISWVTRGAAWDIAVDAVRQAQARLDAAKRALVDAEARGLDWRECEHLDSEHSAARGALEAAQERLDELRDGRV